MDGKRKSIILSLAFLSRDFYLFISFYICEYRSRKFRLLNSQTVFVHLTIFKDYVVLAIVAPELF